MAFEFGETDECKQFFERSPKFIGVFLALMALGNKCFGRQVRPKDRTQDIAFGTGYTCREDFIEVVFSTINGYGFAASKLLRGLYERAVALAYIISDPTKAERMVRFAAIQEHRAMEAALRLVTEEELNKAFGSENSATLIRQRYKEVKPEFETTLCKKCGTKRTQANWDLDIAAMVHKLGEPYNQLYLIAYTIPNFHIHATLASVTDVTKDEVSRHNQRRDGGELALVAACHVFLLVIQSQNKIFSLGLDAEIDACESKLADLLHAHLSTDQSD